MNHKTQPVRGTHDHLPKEKKHYNNILSTSLKVAEVYGYKFMETPIFEFSEVFKKSLGNSSDIVSKEMYTFKDRSKGYSKIPRIEILRTLKNILLILCFGILISCSSNYKRPEALSAKMKRFSPIEEKVNLVPYSAPLSETMKFSRSPASVNKKRNKNKFGSTKTLYFLALFDQFQTLKSYSHLKMPNIEICPHFHNPLLKRKRVIQRKGRLNYSFLKKSQLNKEKLYFVIWFFKLYF